MRRGPRPAPAVSRSAPTESPEPATLRRGPLEWRGLWPQSRRAPVGPQLQQGESLRAPVDPPPVRVKASAPVDWRRVTAKVRPALPRPAMVETRWAPVETRRSPAVPRAPPLKVRRVETWALVAARPESSHQGAAEAAPPHSTLCAGHSDTRLGWRCAGRVPRRYDRLIWAWRRRRRSWCTPGRRGQRPTARVSHVACWHSPCRGGCGAAGHAWRGARAAGLGRRGQMLLPPGWGRRGIAGAGQLPRGAAGRPAAPGWPWPGAGGGCSIRSWMCCWATRGASGLACGRVAGHSAPCALAAAPAGAVNWYEVACGINGWATARPGWIAGRPWPAGPGCPAACRPPEARGASPREVRKAAT